MLHVRLDIVLCLLLLQQKTKGIYACGHSILFVREYKGTFYWNVKESETMKKCSTLTIVVQTLLVSLWGFSRLYYILSF